MNIRLRLFNLFLILFFAVLFLPSTVHAEEILQFSTDITVQPSGELAVIEAIYYDFGTESRHGIYRDIPILYERDNSNYRLRVVIEKVTDETGNDYEFSTSTENGVLSIKIGEADVLITGAHYYLIHYRVARAVNFFDDHDELYWNVTGNDWQVPIRSATASVHLPAASLYSGAQLACFTGFLGLETQACDPEIAPDFLSYRTQENLLAGEGLTIVAGWEKGFVAEPTAWQNFKYFIADNIFATFPLFLPFICFAVMFRLWWKRGRDPKGRSAIIPEYDPPHGMDPMEVGTLYDFKIDKKDISALIIYLAVRGYLKIRFIPKKSKLLGKDDYELIQLKRGADLLKPHEHELMESLFGLGKTVLLSTLKNKFYKKVQTLEKHVYDQMVKDGYFPVDPKHIRSVYTSVGVFIFVLGIFGFGLAFTLALALTICGIIILIFGIFMPSRTKKGVLAQEHILGFKRYLMVAEKDRIEFHNAPEKRPELFEKFLPFAMALGVEQAWAQQFEDIYKQQPDWYDGQGDVFSAVVFSSSMRSFSHDMNGVMAAPSSAGSGGSGLGGGGFSGGGFGGGGGGSW